MTEEITVRKIGQDNGRTEYCLFLDQSNSAGVLHFTHELDIVFCLTEGKVTLLSAWEIGPGGDWIYTESEAGRFESDHPGLIAEIQSRIDSCQVCWL